MGIFPVYNLYLGQTQTLYEKAKKELKTNKKFGKNESLIPYSIELSLSRDINQTNIIGLVYRFNYNFVTAVVNRDSSARLIQIYFKDYNLQYLKIYKKKGMIKPSSKIGIGFSEKEVVPWSFWGKKQTNDYGANLYLEQGYLFDLDNILFTIGLGATIRKFSDEYSYSFGIHYNFLF